MNREISPIRRYASIDFLKVLGSLMILLLHYFDASQYGIPTNLTGGGGMLARFSSYGYLAVELFFLLSGFIAVAFNEEKISMGETSLKEFLGAKWKRWYPCVFFTTLVCMLLQISALFQTGSMVLGLGNYHLFDVLCNFLVVQVGLFSERSMLNVPLWFLTPLLVCYILFFLISKKSEDIRYILCAVCIVIGGICVYYGWNYPILNVRMGRGIYSFFLGALVKMIGRRTHLYLHFGGKLFLLAGLIVGLACFRNKITGNEYLCATILWAMILILILSCPGADSFFAQPAIRTCYLPFYQLSFELFCTQYVVLTAIGLLGRYRDLSGAAENWSLFWGYIILSYALAFLLKKTARPLFSCLLLKNQNSKGALS